MSNTNPIIKHREATLKLANSLNSFDIYLWLLKNGYYPEPYVLPPCFHVLEHPKEKKPYFPIENDYKKFSTQRSECVSAHFPKSDLADRNFGIIHPYIHHDIVFHMTENWESIVNAMIPNDSNVTSYSFPIPLNSQEEGRLGKLYSGRMIYQFLTMAEHNLVSVAHNYKYIVKADIKNFYPSIYTHSIAWALHGKDFIRQNNNIRHFKYLGNRLDKLFQSANDGRTNGIPVGPIVSDIIAEIIASAVDLALTKLIKDKQILCEAVRFKDDYRILVKSESDAKIVIKMLQAALKDFNLELNEDKTNFTLLPNGLFRPWRSKYHAAYPYKIDIFDWRQFQELYLSVVDINRTCPGTGVIDRFLSDIVSREGFLKLKFHETTMKKVISMLFMIPHLHIKAFPKILAIIESIMNSPYCGDNIELITAFVKENLETLIQDEARNRYLISWVYYFVISNDLNDIIKKVVFNDPITKSVCLNENHIFSDCADFVLFEDCNKASKRLTMIKYLDIFNPHVE